MSAAASRLACPHCGTRTGDGSFCCAGCEIVHGLLVGAGLGRFYDLQGKDGVPATAAAAPASDKKWIEVLAARTAAAGSDIQRVGLDIQGLHCAACVWLIEALFARTGVSGRVVVNAAVGKLELTIDSRFPLAEFVAEVERFGYRIGPSLKEAPRSSLLLRTGLCVAIAMNSMIFAIAIYAGLRDGMLHRVFGALNLGLSAVSVAVGGSVFIRSAAQALQRRILHIDLPIALGIVLAFAGSALAFLAHHDDAAYFDTLNVFIALMLVGRWLQERVLDKNRRMLLASDGAEGLLARRVGADGVVAIVACKDVRVGDRLLVAAGDLVCVESIVDEERAVCSLDWVNGESAPRELVRGDTVPAGAFNLGPRALLAVAAADFAGSTLTSLLRAPVSRAADAARATPFWRRFAGIYVVSVLAVATLTFLAWWIHAGPGRALEVTAAVLIVTCPCAFGIATPLAYELVQAGLRRAGLHVRAPGFLDRALDVRQVVFDKTGTITTGILRVVDAAPLRALAEPERQALYNLVIRSTHPRSQAVARALDAIGGARFAQGVAVIETAGKGMEDDQHHRLGASPDGDVVFSRDGVTLATVAVEEECRPDARAELARLAADGREVWILSGDTPERTAILAARVGVPADHAIGGQSPQGKGAWLAAHDHGDTLFIGDGINDSLIVEHATCSGTPAIDRPFMAARSDFYFVTPGLAPIRRALDAAHTLASVTRRNLCVAVVYNLGAIALCAAGLMSPLLAAVIMPATSLSIILLTLHALSPRRPLWTS